MGEEGKEGKKERDRERPEREMRTREEGTERDLRWWEEVGVARSGHSLFLKETKTLTGVTSVSPQTALLRNLDKCHSIRL